jgi:Zn-finger nucleic acid-binding protein
LKAAPVGGAATFRCPTCGGAALTIALLRRFAPAERLRRLWRALADGTPGDPCPSCARPLLVVAPHGERTVAIDVCRGCQLLWFDAEELAAFSPERQAPPDEPGLSPAAAEAFVGAKQRVDELTDDVDVFLGSMLHSFPVRWWTQ